MRHRTLQINANGIKQGYVLAPTLFSIFFSMMLQRAMDNLDEDDGNTYSLAEMVAFSTWGTCRLTQRSWKIPSESCCLLMMPPMLLTLSQPYNTYHLASQRLLNSEHEVSLRKTEVFHQPAPRKEYHPANISIGQTELKAVQQFCYLECVNSSKT